MRNRWLFLLSVIILIHGLLNQKMPQKLSFYQIIVEFH